MNLYVSIPLDSTTKKQLKRLCFGLPQVEWIDEENFILVLREIACPNELIFQDIEDSLFEVDFQPFNCKLSGISHSYNKGLGSISINIANFDKLIQFKKTIERILQNNKVEVKLPNFTPYLLIGTYKSRFSSEKIARYLEANNLFFFEFLVEYFTINSKQITSKRFFYIEHQRYPLKKNNINI